MIELLVQSAPHQGGIWERTVQSVKYHLRRVIGEQLLNFEEFLTLSTKIEAILNSRPITALSSDPAEVDYLTPGHFLIGSPLLALPEPTWEEVRSNRLSRWQLVQAMSQNFWKRWQKDYLHTLQRRGKWTLPQVNIKEGDLVLIHEEISPPLSWRTGRVTTTSPGPDGLVRVVHLHTNKGPLTRAVTKVSPFPIEETEFDLVRSGSAGADLPRRFGFFPFSRGQLPSSYPHRHRQEN
ncbi:uncharacterized protein LOC128996192 [Macrosteles quadrilineatus]|uniref:uncharacterized protein LOC128996192 n=1 Tax=Macrosteles quadrilineatus TaxID=74068 RepID=UPI0023E13984|nr:uncharacterized protein LOC128996192 [Macrosteles quadrilineatus]